MTLVYHTEDAIGRPGTVLRFGVLHCDFCTASAAYPLGSEGAWATQIGGLDICPTCRVSNPEARSLLLRTLLANG